MLSDLDLARFCAACYLPDPNSTFDLVETGTETGGVWVAIKKLPSVDIIIFRGSDDVQDWLRDFDATMISTPLGRIHAGFDLGLSDVHMRLDALKVRPNPIITGHSLGAARAAIYGGMLVNYFDDPAQIALFGCPRPGAQSLADILKHIPINSYRNRSDPVPEVPLPLPELPYTHVRPLIGCSGEVFKPVEDLFKDHDIMSYCNAMEVLNA
jgi:predicted lipase